MKKIIFWQKNTAKNKIHEGLLVEEQETKFIVNVGQYQIEYHYPKAAYEFELAEGE